MEPRIRARLGSRAVAFSIVGLLVGIPAATLRMICFNDSCKAQAQAISKVPFCSLPPSLRGALERGFYEGRTPDLLAIAGERPIVGFAPAGDGTGVAWPSLQDGAGVRVPLIFWGTGVDRGVPIAAGPGLDDIAPTIADIIDLDRKHPEVRSGKAIEGVASGTRPKLVLEVVLEDVGSSDIEDTDSWPYLRSLQAEGAGTLDARITSQPLDPTAILTTIGTGGLPAQHGMTGTSVRDDSGNLVRAWGKESPINVIATLGDDLDEGLHQRPLIGLVGTDVSDRGLVGGRWYIGGDKDLEMLLPAKASLKDQVEAATDLLGSARFGQDDAPDLLGVALRGPRDEMDAAIRRLVSTSQKAAPGSLTVVVTATGEQPATTGSLDASKLGELLEGAIEGRRALIDALIPGGVFVDQGALADLKVSSEVVLKELLHLRAASGGRVFADAFPSIAVTFGKYC